MYNARKVVTELGDEKQCMACGEYWPADTEFFEARKAARDQLSARCIACSKEKRWTYFGALEMMPPTNLAAGARRLQ